LLEHYSKYIIKIKKGGIKMKSVKVEEAVGSVLGHDLTMIIPGKYKGAAFKKGHVIKEEDIEVLKSMGKNHINIIELSDEKLHEDEAAKRIGKAAIGEGIYLSEPSEGKVLLKSKHRGIIKINLKSLNAVNNVDKVSLATRHNNILVEKDEVIGATRIIHLVIEEGNIKKVEDICQKIGKVVCIKELQVLKVGVIITGTEVYEGRIKDKFAPILKDKIQYYGGELLEIKYAPDNREKIEEGMRNLIEFGADIVLATGGMSVDADDVTPIAIKNISDKVVSYGVPALPGNMLMLAYFKDIPIIGIPAGALYCKITSFDLLFPRIMAGDKIQKQDIISLSHGGVCLQCKECIYPNCAFGKA